MSPRLTALVSAVAAAASLALSLPTAAHADHSRPPKLVGMATADFRADWPGIVQQAGRPPALLQLFWTLELTWPNEWAARMLDDAAKQGSAAYIELTTSDLPALASGRKDAALKGMVASLRPWLNAEAGRFVLIAPLPEANLVEHPWGGDPARYRAAFARVRAAFKDGGLGSDKVRFVFAMNGLSSRGLDYRQFWPGDASVDLVGFAKLNRGAPWRGYDETFRRHIDEMRQKISTTKPLIVTQTGSVTTGGNRDAWLREMFSKLAAHPQVVGVVYFNRNKDHDYRVYAAGRLDPAFRDGMRAWSAPEHATWLADGRLDAWVTAHGGRPSRRYGDIGTSPFVTDITWLAGKAITGGCAPDRFCPTARVTRGQMASFLARALDLPAPAAGYDPFTDDDSSPHQDGIERVAAAGITQGCAPPPHDDRFCPDAPVTRAQMASFLSRGLDLAAPAAGYDPFTDDDSSPHQDGIERVAAAGITGGCAPGRYCPGAAVTRQQMAGFLHRALR